MVDDCASDVPARNRGAEATTDAIRARARHRRARDAPKAGIGQVGLTRVGWCLILGGNSMKSGHVLVVDDQIELAENIAEISQGIGFETEVAGSAEAGLERVARGGITAVVTDYRLPGQSGAHLIQELRRRGERIPVLMMSAYTDEATIDRSRAAGAWLFLPKPVPLPTLVDSFRVALPATGGGAGRRRRGESGRKPRRGAHRGRARGRREPHGRGRSGAPPPSADGRPRLSLARRERGRDCPPAAGAGSVDPDPLHFGRRGRAARRRSREIWARPTRWRSRSTPAASSPGSSSPSTVRRDG